MEITEYYRYQAKARGMTDTRELFRTLAEKKPMYDRVLLPLLPVNKEAAIFEAGCGAGIFILWCREHGYVNATGSDCSSEQIFLAKEAGLHLNLSDSVEDIRKMPSGSMDCVVALDFYEHLRKEDFLDFLLESNRVLRKGGTLILRGPNGESPIVGRSYFNDITHQWALTTIAFSALLGMMGYSSCKFYDDVVPSFTSWRIVRVPLAVMAQFVLRLLIRLATRERLVCVSASMFCSAKKI